MSETVGRFNKKVLVKFSSETVIMCLELIVMRTRNLKDDLSLCCSRTWVGGLTVPRLSHVLVGIQNDRKYITKGQVFSHVSFGKCCLRWLATIPVLFSIARNLNDRQVLLYVE